jgi:hypothetical protein
VVNRDLVDLVNEKGSVVISEISAELSETLPFFYPSAIKVGLGDQDNYVFIKAEELFSNLLRYDIIFAELYLSFNQCSQITQLLQFLTDNRFYVKNININFREYEIPDCLFKVPHAFPEIFNTNTNMRFKVSYPAPFENLSDSAKQSNIKFLFVSTSELPRENLQAITTPIADMIDSMELVDKSNRHQATLTAKRGDDPKAKMMVTRAVLKFKLEFTLDLEHLTIPYSITLGRFRNYLSIISLSIMFPEYLTIHLESYFLYSQGAFLEGIHRYTKTLELIISMNSSNIQQSRLMVEEMEYQISDISIFEMV